MEPPTTEDQSASRQLSLMTQDKHFRVHVIAGGISTRKMYEMLVDLDKLAKRILPRLRMLIIARNSANAIRENILTYVKQSIGGAALDSFTEQLDKLLTMLVECEALTED